MSKYTAYIFLIAAMFCCSSLAYPSSDSDQSISTAETLESKLRSKGNFIDEVEGPEKLIYLGERMLRADIIEKTLEGVQEPERGNLDKTLTEVSRNLKWYEGEKDFEASVQEFVDYCNKMKAEAVEHHAKSVDLYEFDLDIPEYLSNEV